MIGVTGAIVVSRTETKEAAMNSSNISTKASKSLGVVILAVALAGPAAAESACQAGITGVGRAANPLNYDPPKHYNMGELAKKRAIANWHEQVNAKCRHDSSLWFRARNKKIECDGYAGGIGCEATAIPARRIFR